MNQKFNIEIDRELYKRLLDHCGSDKEALLNFIVTTLTEAIETGTAPSPPLRLDSSGLQDYLRSSPSGNRGYGVKGQGW